MTAVALLSTGREAGDFTDVGPDLIVDSLRDLTAHRLREAHRSRTV